VRFFIVTRSRTPAVPAVDAADAAVPAVLPHAADAVARARFAAHAPLQVFSCWNGATALDAAPFLATDAYPPLPAAGEGGVANATVAGPLRFRTSRTDATQSNRASECFLPSVDLWRRGLGKIVLVPKARCVFFFFDFLSLPSLSALCPPSSSAPELTHVCARQRRVQPAGVQPLSQGPASAARAGAGDHRLGARAARARRDAGLCGVVRARGALRVPVSVSSCAPGSCCLGWIAVGAVGRAVRLRACPGIFSVGPLCGARVRCAAPRRAV
jgi:hypothetical protein